MSLRSKLAQQASPLLASGERIQAVFLGASQPGNPGEGTCYYYTIVVTDRAILVLNRVRFGKTPRLLSRHHRNVHLGPVKGIIWGSFLIDNTKYWVNWRFFKDVKAADAALCS